MSDSSNVFKRALQWGYNLGEYIAMLLISHERPGFFARWFFKAPLIHYKLGLGWLIGNQVLILTTTGRKTGKSRRTPLGYTCDRAGDMFYVTAGWEGRTDWYHNLRKNPRVRVQVGAREFDACAERAPLDVEIRMLEEYNRRNPFSARLWTRLMQEPFDGSPASLRAVAEKFPMVALRPLNQPIESR